jgi:hypothetical protein
MWVHVALVADPYKTIFNNCFLVMEELLGLSLTGGLHILEDLYDSFNHISLIIHAKFVVNNGLALLHITRESYQDLGKNL